ncbi:hypothetical protein NF867_13830 [Solitalea sp. MAHUQ-68]|uniref:Uncharacterized protein n=1 Tax=Solitalea agri TaxID=2953739 RepID=A0A9X2F482_9SPHI|nr:hypothetical protein [Solitalea agri]MCO4293940.1 hypothetical protein [Solitalea agri]
MPLLNLQKYFRIALFNFFILSLVGLLLRWLMISPIKGLNYQYILHAHSHFAFSGWAFMALMLALSHCFIPAKLFEQKNFKNLIWLTVFTAYGMLLSFPFKGYFVVSIAFSTLFIGVNAWFIVFFFKATYNNPKTLSLKTAQLGLIFLGLSSIGPFTLGPIIANGLSGSPFYYNAIYFYLHFQYNGWLCLGVLSLLINLVEKKGFIFPPISSKLIYSLLLISVLLTYSLSLLWNKPPALAYVIGGLGALLQCFALLFLFKTFQWRILFSLPRLQKTLLLLGVLAFTLKASMQLLSALPYFADLATQIRHLIIGYLHMVFLGCFSCLVLFYSIYNKLILVSKPFSTAAYLFIAGIIITELLLFGGSLLMNSKSYIPHFQHILILASAILPPALFGLWFYSKKE